MPSWSIHLSLANKVKNKLNYNDEFIIANVMPDILNGHIIENPSKIISKNINHFQDGKPPRINIEKFKAKYHKNIKNQIIQGYLVHLITDRFYNEYTYKYHYKFENNRPKAILKNNTKLPAFVEKPWKIKQNDFELYGQKLINSNLIPKINGKINNYNVIEECPINENDLLKTINKINKIHTDKKNYNPSKYRMFSEKELDILYDKCYDKIIKTLKNL